MISAMMILGQMFNHNDVASIDRAISKLYQQWQLSRHPTLQQKIAQISHYFLGRPYVAGPLGEGLEGQFDQSPLFRFDVFDCVTYVNTVLALALSGNAAQFKRMMIRLSYHQGQVAYEKRYHFTSVDWNIKNAKLGLIEDITKTIVDEQGQSVAQMAKALIDRPNWFRTRSLNDIKLADEAQSPEVLLPALHALAEQVVPEQSELAYLPISALVSSNGAPNQVLLEQIPHACVIELVRPNWDLRKEIGTHLNVSHVGFAIRNKQGLMYRQASLVKKQVVDEPLHQYLYDRIASPTIKGINLQRILPQA